MSETFQRSLQPRTVRLQQRKLAAASRAAEAGHPTAFLAVGWRFIF